VKEEEFKVKCVYKFLGEIEQGTVPRTPASSGYTSKS
jgi:hypothetical protein